MRCSAFKSHWDRTPLQARAAPLHQASSSHAQPPLIVNLSSSSYNESSPSGQERRHPETPRSDTISSSISGRSLQRAVPRRGEYVNKVNAKICRVLRSTSMQTGLVIPIIFGMSRRSKHSKRDFSFNESSTSAADNYPPYGGRPSADQTGGENTLLLVYASADVNNVTSNHVTHTVIKRGSSKKKRTKTKDEGNGVATSPVAETPADLQGQYQRHDCEIMGCKRVKINVSGQYFETRVGLLNRHPDTLLGNSRKRQPFYDNQRDEYFIDRHRPSFEAVFSYYQYGGKIKRPANVPDDVFLKELYFYELEHEIIEEYKKSEGYVSENIILPKNEMMKFVWMLFEYPETSHGAFAIAVMSVIMTITSIILFCVETLPVFAMTHCVTDEAPNFLDPFFVIETVCTAWFTIELIIRFLVCPSKLMFWRDIKNVIDALAILPYYVTFINVVSTMSCASAKSSASLAFLRVIRLIRIFKLTKHSVGLQVLILTFKASIQGLGLFLVAFIVCMLVFSSAIYYAELGVPGSNIHSIPDAFWWAIITMTTVGYGDKVPLGPLGRVVGCLCAIVGVLTLAIPVPIITGNFNRFYAHKTGRGRRS